MKLLKPALYMYHPTRGIETRINVDDVIQIEERFDKGSSPELFAIAKGLGVLLVLAELPLVIEFGDRYTEEFHYKAKFHPVQTHHNDGVAIDLLIKKRMTVSLYYE